MTAHLAKKLAAAYLACLVAFSLLLVGAFLIPTDLMHTNAQRSLATLQDEGVRKRIVGQTEAWQLDNFTTAIMINIATHGDGMGAYGAFSAFYYNNPEDEEAVIESLRDGLGKEADPSDPHWASYARYWNGWTVALKPLLIVADLSLLRIVSLVLLALEAIVVVALLIRRMGLGALAVPLALLAVNAPLASASLSLAASMHISLVACIALAILQGRSTPGDTSAKRRISFAALFFVVGAITVYLDFLCTPLLTLGLPCALHVALDRDAIKGLGGFGRKLGGIISLCVAWGLGYALLWMSKWLLSTAICGWNVLENASGSIGFRISDVALGAKHTFLSVVRLNMETWLPLWMLTALAAVWVILLIAAAVHTKRSGMECSWAAMCAVLVVGLLPFAWYASLMNHSWTHAWFTYRDLAIPLAAALLALWALVPPGAFARSQPRHRAPEKNEGVSESFARGQVVSGRQHSQSLAYEAYDDEDYGDYDAYYYDDE